MTADDCEAVARIRVRGWQHAYAGLMPAAYLDAMSVEEDAARRREQFAAGGSRVVNVVAERAGEPVGWGCFGPSRDTGAPDGTAELYALYVRPEHLSTGVGRSLMAELRVRAAARGYRSMSLWVLTDNVRARRFYTKAGFTPDGASESYEVANVPVPEVRYAGRLAG